MTDTSTDVTGGVDSHADTHHAAVIDQRGRLLDSSEFPATARGYQQLAAWLRRHGQLGQVGIEGSGSYGAGLTRYLQACGISIVEVNRPHAHTTARRGKTDAIDAEAAARKVLAGECTAVPKDTTGAVEAIRHLLIVRASAIKSRTAALNQFDKLLVTAPAPVREGLTAASLAGKATQAASWRPDSDRLGDPVQSAKYALRSLARRIHALTTEAADIERQLAALVHHAAPRTIALLGIGPIHAAQMLTTAGQNIDRLHGETAFAHLCAADPIAASSGKTTRHRLNPFGDRDANRTLHMIAVVRLRYCDRTRAYATRRAAEGLSKKDVMRCLKRYIAREIYYRLRADLKNLALAD
jgi:transposase